MIPRAVSDTSDEPRGPPLTGTFEQDEELEDLEDLSRVGRMISRKGWQMICVGGFIYPALE